jgi:hypothetical protein
MAMSIRNTLVTAFYTLLWFGSSTFCQIRTKQVFQQRCHDIGAIPFDNHTLYCFQINSCNGLLLSASQSLVGFLMGIVLVILWERSTFTLSVSYELTMHGLLHAFGNVFTNMSLLFGSVSLTVIIKSLEPVVSLVHQRLIVRQFSILPAWHELFGTIFILIGSMTVSCHDVTFSPKTFMSSSLSVITLNLRNILSSQTASQGNHGPFSIFFYSSLIATSSIVFVAMLLCNPSVCHISISDRTIISAFLQSCFHHALYQVASMLLLHRLTVFPHAIINVCKRACILLAAQLFLANEMPMDLGTIAGVMLTFIGLAIFLTWPHLASRNST